MEDNTTGKESIMNKLTGGNAKIICGIITVVAIFLIVFLILSYEGEKVYKPGTDSGGGGVPAGPVVAGKGDTVYVTYVGRFENGTVFDSGDLSFIAGSGQMIIGLDEAIIGMLKGEGKNITIPMEKAYGDYDPEKIVNVERVITLPRFVNISVNQYRQELGKDPVGGEFFSSSDVPWQVRIAAVINDTLLVDLSPNKDKFTEIIGERIVTLNKNEIILQLNLDSEPDINTVQMTQNGPAIISKINATSIVLDFNNPLAGKTLMFEIKVNDILRKNESSAPQQPAENRVVIIEFSDFQCSYCSKAVPTLNKIKETYGDKVEIVFRQFPLSFHSSTQNASESSECARDQGKFREYHDKLFANQMALSNDDLKKYASELGLDTAKFNQCLDNREKMQVVQKDITAGQEMGVTATPTFFIGDYKLIGAQPFETFKKVIDEKLNASDTQTPVETNGE
jgi:protein-disulfide isomerase